MELSSRGGDGKRIAPFLPKAHPAVHPEANVRPIALPLTLLVLAIACENSKDPFLFGIGGGGGGAVTQVQASGNWSFSVRKTTTLACTGGSLADGSILPAHLDVLADGTLNTSTSTWQNPPSAVVFPLTGTVSLSTGAAGLIFSGGSGSGSGMELRGTISPTGSFTGTLSDPAPGLSPMFSAGGCEYATSGTKT
jgi:hypothetical protein